MKHWNKTEAFAHFATKLTNVRWSWSAMSEDGSTVAIVLWQDGVKGKGGELTYADDDDLEAEWRRRPGHAERVEHLKHSRNECGGRFRAVIARAVDTNADPRQIASCYPQRGVWWELNFLDEATGAFRAHVVRDA